MTLKRCDYLIPTSGVGVNGSVECIADKKQCPKTRLKCIVSQACWKVKVE